MCRRVAKLRRGSSRKPRRMWLPARQRGPPALRAGAPQPPHPLRRTPRLLRSSTRRPSQQSTAAEVWRTLVMSQRRLLTLGHPRRKMWPLPRRRWRQARRPLAPQRSARRRRRRRRLRRQKGPRPRWRTRSPPSTRSAPPASCHASRPSFQHVRQLDSATTGARNALEQNGGLFPDIRPVRSVQSVPRSAPCHSASHGQEGQRVP